MRKIRDKVSREEELFEDYEVIEEDVKMDTLSTFEGIEKDWNFWGAI
mgnify:CR=1 FL=1